MQTLSYDKRLEEEQDEKEEEEAGDVALTLSSFFLLPLSLVLLFLSFGYPLQLANFSPHCKHLSYVKGADITLAMFFFFVHSWFFLFSPFLCSSSSLLPSLSSFFVLSLFFSLSIFKRSFHPVSQSLRDGTILSQNCCRISFNESKGWIKRN